MKFLILLIIILSSQLYATTCKEMGVKLWVEENHLSYSKKNKIIWSPISSFWSKTFFTPNRVGIASLKPFSDSIQIGLSYKSANEKYLSEKIKLSNMMDRPKGINSAFQVSATELSEFYQNILLKDTQGTITFSVLKNGKEICSYEQEVSSSPEAK